MSNNSKVTILGCGASVGVPMIGCECDVCKSPSPFNKRLRTSVLLETEGKRFVIDAGPDFRQQALRANLSKIDGLLITHSHQDHVAGLDDLRPVYYYLQSPVPLLLSHATAEDLSKRFDYFFNTTSEAESKFKMHFLERKTGSVLFQDVLFGYATYEQGGMQVNAYRAGNFAYVTDIKHFDESLFKSLEGVDVLIVSALRMTSSLLHLCVDEAVDFAKKVGAKKTYLTHLSHDLDYEQTNAYLPDTIKLAYDGLEIYF